MDVAAWDIFLLHKRDERLGLVAAIYGALRKLNLRTFCEYECVDWGQTPLTSIDSALLGCRVVVAVVSRDFFDCERSMKLLDVALELTHDKKRQLVLVSVDIDVSSDRLVHRTPRLPWSRCIKFLDCDGIARHVQSVLKGLLQDPSLNNKFVQTKASVPDIGMLFQLLRDSGDNVVLVKDTLLLISERAMTDDRQSVSCVKGFEPVVAMLLKYPDDSIIFQHGLAVIARMCFGNIPNKVHALECGAMSQVLRALKKFENFRDVLQEALACVKNLCLEYEENRRDFVESNGISLIVRVMRQYEDDLVLQRWTCAALCASISHSAFSLDQFVGGNGLGLLSRALQFVVPGTCGDRDEIIQKWACHLIAQLANIAREQLLDMGVLQQCEITRQQFPLQSPAYEAASHAIHCLLHPDKAGFTTHPSLSSSTLDICFILRDMRGSPHCSPVLAYGLTFMFHNSVSSRRDFLHEGGMQTVVQVMNNWRHVNDEEIQRLACRAIKEYCCESDEARHIACEAGAITAVVRSLRRFLTKSGSLPIAVELVQMACEALAEICTGTDESYGIAASCRAPSAVVQAMQCFKHSYLIHRAGSAALCALCEGVGKPDHYGLFRDGRTIIACLLHALRTQSGDETIVWFACRTIKAMCTIGDTEGILNEMGAVDCLRSVAQLYETFKRPSCHAVTDALHCLLTGHEGEG